MCLMRFPLLLTSSSQVKEMLTCLNQAVLCPGNPDDDFVALCRKRGGVLRGERGHGDVIASLDDSPVVDPLGSRYEQTIRQVDCALLCLPTNTRYPQRCMACKLLRNTLRASVCKSSSNTNPTSTSSHVPYSSLSHQQKEQRLKNLKQSLKAAKQQIRRLKERQPDRQRGNYPGGGGCRRRSVYR